jgi:hypothetical protein
MLSDWRHASGGAAGLSICLKSPIQPIFCAKKKKKKKKKPKIYSKKLINDF